MHLREKYYEHSFGASLLKRVIRRCVSAIFGEQRFSAWMGALDCIFHRQPSTGFGGPLNGSPARLAAFEELKRRCSFDAIVETGTYLGESTIYFGAAGCPVYSSEVNPRYMGYARMRLRSRPNVHISLGDSRKFLRRLIEDPNVPKDKVFFYLDAHWQDDLPLREEVDLIFRNWKRAVVMVDDFRVPDDLGYKFDDYGEGKSLSLEYLDLIAHLGFTSFFPALPSSEEPGYKRGWVVLAIDKYSIGQLREISQVREWQQIRA